MARIGSPCAQACRQRVSLGCLHTSQPRPNTATAASPLRARHSWHCWQPASLSCTASGAPPSSCATTGCSARSVWRVSCRRSSLQRGWAGVRGEMRHAWAQAAQSRHTQAMQGPAPQLPQPCWHCPAPAQREHAHSQVQVLKGHEHKWLQPRNGGPRIRQHAGTEGFEAAAEAGGGQRQRQVVVEGSVDGWEGQRAGSGFD